MKFHKIKKALAAILSGTMLSMAILPYINQTDTQAFSSSYGVCIDNHNYSTAGSWSRNDRYTNKMINMNTIQDQYGYGSPEYNNALQQNVNVLRSEIGDDEKILKMFWAGLVTWVSNGKTFQPDNPLDTLGSQYWINYAQVNYQDSVSHGYAPALATYDFVPMSESELGTVIHGAAGQALIDRDPFLKMLTDPHTLFQEGDTYDANRNYETDPLALPRLGNSWLNSYEETQSGQNGRATWPINSQGHEVSGPSGFMPDVTTVQQVALDMETDENYIMERNGDKTIYWIDCGETFFNNSGNLVIWNTNTGGAPTWSRFPVLQMYQKTININGWDIYATADTLDDGPHWFIRFEYTGGNTPTDLTMYFELPQNSVTSANTVGFNSAVEFVARYTNLYTCDSCGGTHGSGTLPLKSHQRHVSFYFPTTPLDSYPCFRLGDPISPTPEVGEAKVNFEIFSHNEDWDSHYNVQLDKYDYETGEPLEGSVFELYERFDDQDQVNTENDGAVELYEGGDDKWDSTYTSSPVIWDDFRLVDSFTTDDNGHIEETVVKSYHYEKTFCDGHPAPEFVAVPEPEEDEETGEITNQDEIDAAKEANKEAALLWLQYYEDCTKMADEDRPGVHFHWMMDEVLMDVIEEVSESGGEANGDAPDAGPTEGADLDTSFDSSGCQQDCQDTYDKFINLEYSYTWIEQKARDGYIRHDKHTDDVPIEVITTDSSEAGANSYFADEYSKDIEINDNVNNVEPPDTDTSDEEEEIIEDDIENSNEETTDTSEVSFVEKAKNVLSSNVRSALQFIGLVDDEEIEETEEEKVASPSEAKDEDEYDDTEDYDIEFDSKSNRKIASPSNATVLSELSTDSNEKMLENRERVSVLASDEEDGDSSDSGYSAEYTQIYEDSFEDPYVGGEDVELGPDDNYSHCNDVDGEGNAWRVYDHRTEGEIHFNKRDLDLSNNASDEYSTYAQENADGKLEGAVYGLFAKNAIEHPDGKTGTIFQANDLVAIATTDRNGDGSFMAITEAPGTRYDYETGSTYTTDWYTQAPNNLYRDGSKNGTDQPNVVFNEGEGTIWHNDDYTEDGTYKGGLTQRLYDSNEENNMNSWNGRPLFMGEYYIKELSRSEGYELSVNGKSADITNNGADLDVVDNNLPGSVSITRNMYIQGQESVGEANEIFFEVSSEGTNENGGYDIVLSNLPEGVRVYRHDQTTTTGTYQVIDHYENQPMFDDNGNPVYETALTAGVPILKGDGSDDFLTYETNANYYLSNIQIADIHSFNQNRVDEVLQGEATAGTDGNPYYQDLDLMADEFSLALNNFDTYFIKEKLESVLRTAGIRTPYYQGSYSNRNFPVYQRGIREGEIDYYGVSGVAPGEIADKTVYGPQILNIEFDKVTTAGTSLTNGDIIYNLIQYYMDNPYWTFGGIDRIVENADTVNVYIYASNLLNPDGFVVAGSDLRTESDIYRGIEFDANGTDFEPYIVYVKYNSDGSDDAFGSYTNFSTRTSLTGTVYVSATLTPDVTIDDEGNLEIRKQIAYEYYDIGDIIHDKDGNPVQKTESVPVYVDREVSEIETSWTEIPVRYEDGKYIIHIDMSYTDFYGQTNTDADELKTIEFKAVVPERDHILTAEDISKLPSSSNLQVGDIMSSGTYEVYTQFAKAYAYLDYEQQQEAGENSYIASVILSYPGDEYTYQDGENAPGQGTIRNPIGVFERPIRQRIKVQKDIQINPETKEVWYCDECGRQNSTENTNCEFCNKVRNTEMTQTITEYAHDTYSEVHSENLAPDEYNRWYEKIADWLTNLINGDDGDNSTSVLPNFRFKAYLKSNLERLYRDNDGNITWLDRNGNALVPEYQDTDGDGNYDTFVWVSGNNTIDFPEQDKIKDNSLYSSNVQKIYTEVEHNSTSTTTGDISNNTWAEYADPQTGETTNVGSLRGYNTSQDGENGEAINTNDSLYSYDDKNTNVAESDKINENQNQGYTRLLETTVNTVEDGAGETREVEQYNYEKFFDAIAAANTDKWDNDMYTTYDGHGMENYPGQHWFDTFEERYQKDDADLDGTIENTDGTDADGTAGGDRDTSFKPFQWIREQLFGTTEDAKNNYPATHDNNNLENDINVGDVNHNDSDIAHINAEASDAVRAFAIKWYLDDEVAKLVTNNGYDEDVAKKGSESYQEEVYDQALFNALEKTYNYIRPFYNYDLDTIYSVEWDTAANGGKDGDYTTLSADTLYNNEYYYGVSAYLPYGTYILVEQQPYTDTLDDFTNKHYKVDKPKEVTLPSVYEADGNNTSPEVFDDYYNYNSADTPEQLAEKYFIRFNEEWAENYTDDQRDYVIRAHNKDGDYEIYKYGLDVDKLTTQIEYNGITYDHDGYKVTQDEYDPLKNYYNDPLVDTAHEGGNTNSHYFADDDNVNYNPASGNDYEENAIEKRYHYGSISENAGTADNVIYQHGNATDDNNPSGFYFKDNVKTMTGNQTAYEGKYASMLVPWTVIEPVDAGEYDSNTFSGYADGKFRNTFYTTKFRIEKLDSETGEQILHDDAIFALYAASRYTSQAEIEEAGAPKGTEIGDVKFYMEDTTITGSKEFLESMGAVNIEPVSRGVGELYSGTVSAGTPVCVEEEQIILTDQAGNKTGQFKFYTTLADVETLNEEDTAKSYKDQNVGYLVTPEPLGAGVYVLAETKAPTGYAKTKPIAVEVYSDGVTYYMNGLMDSQVDATVYSNNLISQNN